MTDFGADSPYVAAMKAAVFERSQKAVVLDLTHSITPQNVRQGAAVWYDFTKTFPAGSVHVGVVDPEVGGNRRLIAARCGEQYFVCPDNGLLTFFLRKNAIDAAAELDNPQFWRTKISATFHGRDVMAPVAASLADSVPLEKIGKQIFIREQNNAAIPLVQLPLNEPIFDSYSWELEILYVDSFGNLQLNVSADTLPETAKTMLSRSPRLRLKTKNGNIFDITYVKTYCHQPPESIVLLESSCGRLEIAAVNANAAKKLGVGEGEKIDIECSEFRKI